MGKRARAAGGGDRPAKNYVYTLNLAGGHKYVGTTTQPVQRIGSHFAGAGAKWTQKHQPISVNSIMKCKSAAGVRKKSRDYCVPKNECLSWRRQGARSWSHKVDVSRRWLNKFSFNFSMTR